MNAPGPIPSEGRPLDRKPGLKIAQFKTSAGRAGAEILLMNLTNELRARGHQVHTFIAEEGWLADQLKEAGQPREILSLNPLRLLWNAPKLWRDFAKGDYDIILSHGARVSLLAALFSRRAAVPLVTVEHNIDDWRDARGLRYRIDRWVGKTSVKRIAVSGAVGKMLVDRGIISPDKIEIIANEILPPHRPDSINEIRKMFFQTEHLKEPDLSIVTIARFSEQKGHSVLIRAMARVLVDLPSVQLYLFGEGKLEKEIRSLAQSLRIGGSVHFLGSRDNVTELLPIFDLFVLPSLWEGLPIALLEAMGLGLPVIATAVGGIPEVITDRVNGLLVPPGDEEALSIALLESLRNSTMRKEIGEAGFRHFRNNLNFFKMVDRYEALLESEVHKSVAQRVRQ